MAANCSQSGYKRCWGQGWCWLGRTVLLCKTHSSPAAAAQQQAGAGIWGGGERGRGHRKASRTSQSHIQGVCTS